MRRVGLIAGREIAAYAGVPSFWVALFMGPVLMLLIGLAGRALISQPAAPSPRQVAVVATDPMLAQAAATALRAAATREGRALILKSTPAATAVQIETDASGNVGVQLSGEPLSQPTVAMLRDELDGAARRERLRQAGASPAILAAADSARVVVQEAPLPAAAPTDVGRTGRFAVMMLLWMTLIGALGMLLQAIVRERTNRALESLLASARAHEIIFGKLVGVGALSLLVLGVWLGAGAAMAASPMGSLGGSLPAILLGAFADPLALLRAGVIYILSFAMYGTALIGLGAIARDVPSAQNLSRPVFGVLLLVFFVGLADFAGTGAGLHWLAWVPLFTPFVSLMAPPGAIGAVQTAVGFAGMLLATAAFGWLATRAMMSDGARPRRVWVERTHDRRAAA
jgi:ABC-2 type transport system permease protein